MYIAFEPAVEEGKDFLSAKEACWNKGLAQRYGSLMCSQGAEKVRVPGAWNLG